MNQWYQAVVPKDYSIEKFFQLEGFLGSMERENVMILYFEKKDSLRKMLENFNLSVISEGDWVETWKEYFVPVKIGNITVAPPWRKKEGDVVINPSRGFGTGHHETTQLSVLLIEEVLKNDNSVKSMMDVGTGSGILSVAALKMKPDLEVTAIDNDSDALENAFENAMLNDCMDSINISREPLFKFEKPSDLVVANIISSVLYFLSEDIKRLSSKWLILSGIIDSETGDFLKKMGLENFELIRKVQKNEWNGFLLKRVNNGK
jgi:ribosomal protein L11 methyltransferase